MCVCVCVCVVCVHACMRGMHLQAAPIPQVSSSDGRAVEECCKEGQMMQADNRLAIGKLARFAGNVS